MSSGLHGLPAGLNGAEIVSNNLLQLVKPSEIRKIITSAEGCSSPFRKLDLAIASRQGETQTHLNSPDACPAPNIKNSHSFWIDRG
jgi:hypothetical protein